MPDAAPAGDDEGTAPGHPAALTADRIDAVLADFRHWLETLRAPDEALPPAPPAADLFALVGSFAALRQEVNMQTRATRSAIEKVEKLAADAPAPEEQLKPLLKAILDAYDALAVAARNVEKQRDALGKTIDEWASLLAITVPPLPEVARGSDGAGKSGFWSRLSGVAAPGDLSAEREQLRRWRDDVAEKSAEAASRADALGRRLRGSLDGLVEGYTMSLNRIDRVLPLFGVEAIATAGGFDPETMEVVEVVPGEAGKVVEEVKRGYRWNGKLFREAKVKVAR